MLLDLHNHTAQWSFDSVLSVEQLIHEAKLKGLDGVCFTDHDWFWDPGEVDLLSKKHHFLVIPGVEITTEEGHVLAFGLERYVFGMHRASFLKEAVDAVEGAMIVAHPYRRHYYDGYNVDLEEALAKVTNNPLLSYVDAIEVFNGRGSEKENSFSQALSRRLSIAGVGCSDAHDVKDVAKCATRFEGEITCLQDLIREIKAGRFRAERLGNHR